MRTGRLRPRGLTQSPFSEIVERDGVTDRFVSITLNLAFLSPAVVEAILDGRQAATLAAKGLSFDEGPAMRWSEQTAQFLQLGGS